MRNVLLTMVLTASCMPLAAAGPLEEIEAAAYYVANYEVCVPDVQCTSVAALVTICVLDLPCIHPSDVCVLGLPCPPIVEEAIQCASGDPGCGSGQGKIIGKIKVVLP